ncbi:MAG: PPC domain-containing DNA-binding protein [Chlamydiota bacterium]
MHYADFADGFILKIEREEEVHQVLTGFANQKRIPSAFYHGIGALKEISLGYFDVQKKDYLSQKFSESYELLSLQGNLSFVEGAYFPHTHVVLSNGNYQTIGGHLFSGVVSVTVELFFFPIDIALERKSNVKLNFKELDLAHHFSE